MRLLDRAPHTSHRARGFSLVELLVALMFTAILMAGLATVFQASLGTFVTSGEKISGARRNRMAIDMIFDDLNAAGMLLTSLSDYGGDAANPITLNALNPPFRIIPNVSYASTDVAAPNNVTDQLFLYFDEALPFEGTVSTAIKSVAEVGVDETAYDAGMTPIIECRDASQANFVNQENGHIPLSVLFRADIASSKKPTGLTVSGNQVTVGLSNDLSDPNSGPPKNRIPAGTPVLFVKPGLYVRYSIQPRSLDPDPAAGQIPCLIRDEVQYRTVSTSATPFAAPLNSTIIAENVIGFQVMVSPDGGATWVNNPYDPAQNGGVLPSAGAPGIPHTIHADWAALRGLLNANAAIAGRPASHNQISDDQFWFKDIPVTVRVDITTRTARARGEYQQNNPVTIINGTGGIPYKIQTQSIVLVPRHFGLSYGAGLL